MPILLVTLLLLPPADNPPRYERLDNGLQLVVVEDRSLPLVSVQLWFQAGDADDPAGLPGAARAVCALLEWRDDAALRARAAGLRVRGRTLPDATAFETLLPASVLDFVLSLEAQRLRAVEEEQVSGTRATLPKAGRRTVADIGVIERDLRDALFDRHHYGVARWRETSAGADEPTPQAVAAFARRWFTPSNATLLVVGDVSTPVVVRMVREKFSSLPWSGRPRRRDADLPRPGLIERAVALDLQNATVNERRDRPENGPPVVGVDSGGPEGGPPVAVGWIAPPLGSFQNAVLDVLMEQLLNPLDGSLAARWPAEARPRFERRGWRDAGMLYITAGPLGDGPEALRRAADTIWEEIRRAAHEAPTETAHNRNRAAAKARAARVYTTFEVRAARLAELEAVAGNLMLAEFDLAAYERVSVLDVQQAAMSLLERRRAVIRFGAVRDDAAHGGNGQSVATASAAPGHREETGQRPVPQDYEEPGRRPVPHDDDVRPLPVVDVPMPTTPRPAPRVERVRRAGSPALHVCALPGLRDAAVVTVPVSRVRGRPLAEGKPLSAVPGLSADEAAEYLALRAIALEHANMAGGESLVASGPADAVWAMLEISLLHVDRGVLSAEHPTNRDRKGTVRAEAFDVFVVGDVDASEVAEVFGMLVTRDDEAEDGWGGHSARPDRQNADSTQADAARQATSDERDGTGLRIKAEWLAGEGPPSFEFSLRFDSAEGCPEHSGLSIKALAALLGAGSPARWDLQREGPFLAGRVTAGEEDLPDRLDDFRETLRAARDGSVAPQRLEAALRRARCEVLFRLQDARSIADALQRGAANPWELHSDIGLEEWRNRISGALRGARLELRALGGGDAVRAAVARLQALDDPRP